LRAERWKYIEDRDLAGATELYELKADPLELRNLIGEASAQAELRRMQRRLAEFEKQTA
jgi:hypothetical protein